MNDFVFWFFIGLALDCMCKYIGHPIPSEWALIFCGAFVMTMINVQCAGDKSDNSEHKDSPPPG